MKYVRVQLVMLGGFILTFLGAAIFNIADGAPLSPLQILWVNFAIDLFLAVGLGFDQPIPGLMARPPRDAAARIVSGGLAVRLTIASLFMAGLTLAVVAWGQDRYDLRIATTMGLTTLALMHVAAALEAREPKGTIFARYTIENARFLQMIGAALLMTFLVTALAPLQRIFGTAALSSRQWGICLLGALVLLALLECGKLADRHLGRRPDGPATTGPVGSVAGDRAGDQAPVGSG
jgi:Ca2+-transporting ATPase